MNLLEALLWLQGTPGGYAHKQPPLQWEREMTDHQAPVTLLSTSDTWNPSRASFQTPVHALCFAGGPQSIMHRTVLS